MSYHNKVPVLFTDFLTNTVPPVVSGIAYHGQTMSTTNGTWSSSSPISYSYQWQVSYDSGSNYSNISGATSSTYVVSAQVEGGAVRCEVTATNAGSSSSALSNSIENWIPSDDVAAVSWWDPSDISTITESGGAVSQIDDKIGSEALVQTTGSAQPTTGTQTLNGLNVLFGDGEDYIKTSSSSGISSSGNFSLFAVQRFDVIDSSLDGSIAVGDNGGGTPNSLQLSSGNGSQFNGRFLVTSLGAPSADLAGGPYPGPSIFNVEGDFSGNSLNVYIDSESKYNNSNYTNKITTTEPIMFFANRQGTSIPEGIMSEMIHTESVDQATREKIEGYLSHKYNLTSNLPSGHPYKTTAPTI